MKKVFLSLLMLMVGLVVNAQVPDVDSAAIIIKEKGVYDLLDDKVKESAEYRVKYPESSLLELSKIMTLETGSNISKSCLNHRFRKIKEFSEKIRSQN